MNSLRNSTALAALAMCCFFTGPAAAQNGTGNAFGVPPSAPNPGIGPMAPQAPSGPQFGGFPTPQPAQPSPAQPYPAQPSPEQQPMSIQQYLVGVWHGLVQDQAGQWDIVVTFLPDSTFVQQQTLIANRFRLQIMGQYQAQLGPDGGVLQYQPQRWQPQQVCQSPNACQPISLQPTAIRFRLLGRDSLQSEQGTFQRVGSVP